MEVEDSKLQTSIQCTPTPGKPTSIDNSKKKEKRKNASCFCIISFCSTGPFKPCDYMFDSWVERLGVWDHRSGFSRGQQLADHHCLHLAQLPVACEVCHRLHWLEPTSWRACAREHWLWSTPWRSESSPDTAPAGRPARAARRPGSSRSSPPRLRSSSSPWRPCSAASLCPACEPTGNPHPSAASRRLLCAAVTLSLVVGALPLFRVGKYGSSPLCLPSPLPEGQPSTLGFMVALIMMNTLCFLVITGTYIKLYWDLIKGEFDSIWECAMIKHVAWLIFTNCLLYCPVAFLTFSSLLSLFPVGEEVIKSVLLVSHAAPGQPQPITLPPLQPPLQGGHPHALEEVALNSRGDARLLRLRGDREELVQLHTGFGVLLRHGRALWECRSP